MWVRDKRHRAKFYIGREGLLWLQGMLPHARLFDDAAEQQRAAAFAVPALIECSGAGTR